MNLFYSNQIIGSIALLDQGESHHCVKVLRMRKGDQIHFIDGNGGYYQGKLIDDHPLRCEISIQEIQKNFEKRSYYLHLAIAPTKNHDRFEWFVEKATEIGVDKLTPLLCDHSERKNIRLDRIQKVVLSAVKQSKKAWIPMIEPLIRFEDFIHGNHPSTDNYIAHCAESEKKSLLHTGSMRSSYLVLIGPEGDFSEREIEFAKESGFIPVSIGKSRLRTETAGMVIAQIISDIESLKNIPG